MPYAIATVAGLADGDDQAPTFSESGRSNGANSSCRTRRSEPPQIRHSALISAGTCAWLRSCVWTATKSHRAIARRSSSVPPSH